MEISWDLARTLDVVVAAGTLDAAAERLSVTPSAVSQRLKALETRVGRVLLVRARPVRPTTAGEAVLRLSRQMAVLEADARVELGLDAEGPAEVALAVNADSLATWFLPALAPLAGEVVFHLHRDDQDRTAGLLESGIVAAAVTSQRVPVAGCSVRPLGAMRYVAVASVDFAARWFAGGVNADALARAPVVDFDEADDLQARHLAARGVEPGRPPRHRVPSSHDFGRAIELGFGWGLLPEWDADAAVASGRLVPLGGLPVEVRLYWQRWKLASNVLTRVEDVVVTAARSALRAS